MPLGKPVQGLSGNELLCDLPFELDAVGTLSGHGFHPLKAQLTLSTHEPQLVRPQGAHSTVGGNQKTRWHGKTDRLCRFQVENHFVLGGSLRRYVGRLCAVQNMVNNGSGQPVLLNVIEAVRHKTASADETRKGVNRGQAVLEGERNDTLAMHEDCRVGKQRSGRHRMCAQTLRWRSRDRRRMRPVRARD